MRLFNRKVFPHNWLADFGFSIGMVPEFMWGERPFSGLMSEVRLWDVVRTPSQIKENMLFVDPETPGLVLYYKLNGDCNDSTSNASYKHISQTDIQEIG